MLGVQLPTCVSSPDRSTSVQLEFSPTVPLSVLCCFSGWPNLIEAQNSLTYRGPLPLSCSCGREHIPFIGLSDDSTFRTSSVVLGSAPNSGFPAFTTIFWKGVPFPLGMAIEPGSHSFGRFSAPITVAGLRFVLRYGPRTKRGKLVRLRRHLWWTSLLQILFQPISLLRTVLLWVFHLGLVCARSGRCPGFRCLLYFWPALLLALLPRVQRSVHCARDLAHPVV